MIEPASLRNAGWRPGRWRGAGRMAVGAVAVAMAAGPVRAQVSPSSVRRPLATRAELEALAAGMRDAHEDVMEAQILRHRLTVGDFEPGDQIEVQAPREESLAGIHMVTPDRTIQFQNIPAISLGGVLRSELTDHLREQLGKYIRQPEGISATALIRLTITGEVNSPGFYQIPANTPLGDAMMKANGLSREVDLKKSIVRRGEQSVLEGDALALAIREGTSLDLLNLQGGDQIQVGRHKSAINLQNVAILLTIPISIAALTRIF